MSTSGRAKKAKKVVEEHVEEFADATQESLVNTADDAADVADSIKDKAAESAETAQQSTANLVELAAESADDATETTAEGADDIQEKVNKLAADLKASAGASASTVRDTGERAHERTQKAINNAQPYDYERMKQELTQDSGRSPGRLFGGLGMLFLALVVVNWFRNRAK